MKKTLFSILILLSLKTFSQTYEVEYSLEQTAKNINLITNIKAYLKGNGKYSIYEEDFERSRTNSGTDSEIISLNRNPILYKEILEKKIFFKDQIRFNFFDILDSTSVFKWEIQKDTKTILNYKCQKAVCEFRSRKYEVYFTTELTFSDGPWKFYGLPGLILEVYSNDNVATFHFIAEKIKIKNETENIKNPYINKELITFDDYVNIYRKKYDESLYRVVNENGETRPMSKGFREYFIHE
ncbi:GLPGLI family protein [Flavobacterium jejuense]|nr:GLPGLI family protein [Flavobacterium jejuense]